MCGTYLFSNADKLLFLCLPRKIKVYIRKVKIYRLEVAFRIEHLNNKKVQLYILISNVPFVDIIICQY